MKSRIKGIPKDETILYAGSCADAIWAGTSRYTVWDIVLTNKSIWKQRRKKHWYSRNEDALPLPYTLVKQVDVIPNGRSHLVSIIFNMPFQPIPFDVYFYSTIGGFSFSMSVFNGLVHLLFAKEQKKPFRIFILTTFL